MEFRGPLFISGMPRSGTKLLRDILNNHSMISVPESETLFIPYFIKKFGDELQITENQVFSNVVKEFKQTKFFLNMKSTKPEPEYKSLLNELHSPTIKHFIEGVVRYYSPKGFNRSIIWGDKTPGYVVFANDLFQSWNKAKMIHIVRDPRDYSWSVKNAWNRNMYRAAHRWKTGMNFIRKNNALTDDNYKQIYYENLITNPAEVVTSICDFLEIKYEKNMLDLKFASENIGETRGEKSIVSTNKSKYLYKLSKSELAKIESIVREEAEYLGYKMETSGKVQELSDFKLKIYKMLDGKNSLIFHMREKGIVSGFIYFIKLHKHSAMNYSN